MNANSPAVSTSAPSPEGPHPGESSPNDERAHGVSEAMRRVQDLLAAGKLSVSDTVVFEYHRHSFVARVLSDGSLRSHNEPKATGIRMGKFPSKLYSSPSEFASAMAASVALLDEKVATPKGRVSINGWNSCTVNGRSLATIRNEMLHERKNELASLSTERVRESAPVVCTRKQPEHGPEKCSTLGKGSAAARTTGLVHSPHEFGISPLKGKDELPGAHESLAGAKKSDRLTHRDDSASGKGQEDITVDKQDAAVSLEGVLGASSPPRTQLLHNSTENRTSSSPEIPVDPISERASTEQKVSLGTSDGNAGLYDKTPGEANNSQVCEERSTCKNVTKPANQMSGTSKVTDSRQLKGHHDDVAKDGPGMKEHFSIMRDEDEVMKTEEISRLAVEPLHQTKRKEQQPENYVHSVCEDVRSHTLDTHFKANTSSRAEIDLSSESKGSSHESKDIKGKKDDRLTSDELRDVACIPQRGEVILQATSSKEVSDLQQEILGDSDSDDESFPEREKENRCLPKKRSHSPSSVECRKKTRTGGDPHPEMHGTRTTPENVRSLALDDKTLRHDGAIAESDEMHLDPDTVEAAAIAAQIEKEEASTRARRTTRLAAGKIKQVDYKASTGLNTTRSISPDFSWEESNKHSIEIEPSVELARTTRRRSAPNQLQPPQRSSRRMAKLRNSSEREMSSHEEAEYHSVRSMGEGCDMRSNRESTHNEDMDGTVSQVFRSNGLRSDVSDRRKGRTDSSAKRARHHFHEEGDPDSNGRAYSTRASTRENSVVDSAEIEDLRDSNDFPSDAEALEDVSDIDDSSDMFGLTMNDIKCLAEGVRLRESADPELILRYMNEQDQLKNDDSNKHRTRDFFQEIIERIQDLQASLTTQKDLSSPTQVLSFLSAEIWRLSTGGNGLSGKATTLVRKAGKEDQMRVSSERSRKKEHRDVEELRASLEKEMESRRRAELDALFTEIHLCEVSRATAREKTNCCHLEQETKKYRGMERIIRVRLEGAKVLVGQLRGETDEPDAVVVGAGRTPLRDGSRRAEPLANGSFVLPSLPTGQNERIAEDDATMTNKNVTTTSRRLMEMDRLRALIAAREAEGEEFQRISEKERMQFVTTLELKARTETEIFLNKSQGSATYGFGNSSSPPLINSMAKDGLRKGDARGSSTHLIRGPGYTKQKVGSIGKNGIAAQFMNNQKLALAGSRPKPGRATEVPKQVKRKPFGRNGGNGN